MECRGGRNQGGSGLDPDGDAEFDDTGGSGEEVGCDPEDGPRLVVVATELGEFDGAAEKGELGGALLRNEAKRPPLVGEVAVSSGRGDGVESGTPKPAAAVEVEMGTRRLRAPEGCRIS